MGPLTSTLLLESLLLPCLFAGLIVAPTRWSDRNTVAVLAPALAILAAVGSTYVLAFGWPKSIALGSQAKIMLSAIIGLIVGLGIHLGTLRPKPSLAFGAVAIPIWLGLPALLHGRSESVFLILPVFAGLFLSFKIDKASGFGTKPWIVILLTIAIGLASIAAFAKAFSFAELSLALGSALLAILIIGQDPIGIPATIIAGAMLSALMTALLLYSEASLPALALLASALGAQRLAHIASRNRSGKPAIWLVAIFCLLPTVLAILIARIDAGPISIY